MNGSIIRRRQRNTTKLPAPSDTEYFSDGAGQAVEQHHGISTTTGDAHSSSHSEQYASEADLSSDDSDSAAASGSTLPPPTPRPSEELKVPAVVDHADSDLLDAASGRAWYEFDLSVILALLSPVANWLTGSDFVKNFLLILLLVFYLHQIIEVPWSLYLASRPRRALHPLPQDHGDKHHRAALSELHTLEIFYLILSILSPFLGAALLRTVVVSFSGPSTVSWFSLSLFVLATGMRPWKHGIQRLRERTTDLHTLLHYPPSHTQKMQALTERVVQLEAELRSLRKQSKSFNSDMYDHMEDAIEMMEISTRRQEKKAEVSKVFVEGRLMKLEQNVETLLERMEIRADQPVLYRIMVEISAFLSALIDQLSPILPAWIVVHFRGNISRSPRSSPKMARSRTSIKLETIPEVSTFQPKSPVRSSPSFRAPSFRLALRIGDLVTLPLRRVIGYFLAGRIYNNTSNTRAS